MKTRHYQCQFIKYGLRRIVTGFSKINSKSEGLDTSLKNIRETKSTDYRRKSGRPKHARTEENVTTVDDHCGRPTNPARPETKTSFSTPAIHIDISNRVMHATLNQRGPAYLNNIIKFNTKNLDVAISFPLQPTQLLS